MKSFQHSVCSIDILDITRIFFYLKPITSASLQFWDYRESPLCVYLICCKKNSLFIYLFIRIEGWIWSAFENTFFRGNVKDMRMIPRFIPFFYPFIPNISLHSFQRSGALSYLTIAKSLYFKLCGLFQCSCK